MKENKRKMWQFPWRYKESIAIILGITIIGLILQFTSGNFDFFLLQYPVNFIGGIAMIAFFVAFSFFCKKPFYQWFSGISLSVSLIGALLLLTLIMGLTPQLVHVHDNEQDIFTRLGFRQMTSSWTFVLIYVFTLLSLGTLITRRLVPFKKKDYAFYLNHIGLWILMFSAGAGASDMKRYVMYVTQGETEWRVYNDRNDVLELPIAIQLNEFRMEEYPPKLAIIDRSTGAVQPENEPQSFQIDEKRPEGELVDWNITLNEYIHQAVRSSDSTYQAVPMPGSAPAAKVTATHKQTGEQHQGWICGGNLAQLYMTLPLDSQYCVVMTQAEPKKFASDINVFTENDGDAHAIIEVNKPLRVGNWTIYQHSYDNEAGKMSTYSGMELVYDPWLYGVYVGIIMLMIGSLCMLWSGNKKRGETK